MSLELQLNPLTLPEGTEFPGTPQGLLQLISEYVEITGGEDFSGVNYGSTEPDPADRDKAWLRIDEGGLFLGWYVWTGASWTILPSKAYVGTEVERAAIASPQEGWMFHVLGTGLSTYTGSEWEWGFPPADQDLVGDKFYFFPSYQSLVSVSSSVPAWTDIDLSTYITQSGIPADKITAAIVYMRAQFGSTGAGAANVFTVDVRVWSDDSVSTTATDIAWVSARGARETGSGAAAAANTMQAFIPMSGGQTEIYYNVQELNNPASQQGVVMLAGFLYQPF